MLAYIFAFLAHALVAAGAVTMVVFIVLLIKSQPVILEKVILTVSAMTGFLIYFGARSLGVSIPDFMMTAVSTSSPFTFGVLAIALPSAAGVLVAWYCIRSLKRAADVATRLVTLIAVFIIVMFSDVYVASYDLHSEYFRPGTALMPNLSFVVAMSLFVILRFRTKDYIKAAGPQAT